MEKRVLTVCSAVGLLGLLSVVTGFAAEATRVKGNQVRYVTPTTCTHPRSPAVGLGVTAALSLLAAHLTINISSGCICCAKGPRPSGSKRTAVVIFFVISWLAFIVAIILLFTGAALSDRRGEKGVYFDDHNCYVVRPGVFALAAVLSIKSLVLGMCYFLILNSAKDQTTVWRNPIPPQENIAMGQPQFPPPPPPQAINFMGQPQFPPPRPPQPQ